MNADLLKGSILKGLLLFGAPLLVSRIFQLLYSTVDRYGLFSGSYRDRMSDSGRYHYGDFL